MKEHDYNWVREFDASIFLLRGLVSNMIIGNRVTSAAFKATDCSVDRDDLRTPEDTLKSNSKFKGVGKLNSTFPETLNSSFPKQYHQKVIHNPNPGNPAHSLIKGKKSLSVARKLAKNSKIV